MVLTLAFVKNEQSTSYAVDYNTTGSVENGCPRGQNLIATNATKMESAEACTNNTSGKVVNEEANEEHSINHTTDISQHGRDNESEAHSINYTVDISQQCRDNESEGHSINHTLDISQHDRDDEGGVIHIGNTTSSGRLKSQQVIEAKERLYKCDVCRYSATLSGHLKDKTLLHTLERPRKCNVCAYSSKQYVTNKTHKIDTFRG